MNSADEIQSEVERTILRSPSYPVAPPSVLIVRSCSVLIASLGALAIWMALSPLSRHPRTEVTLWMGLALITAAGAIMTGLLYARARQYEAKRDSEKLLFQNARDAMLLVRVQRSQPELAKPPSFIIKAENPAAVERLGAFGQKSTYVGRNIDEVFPDWLLDKIKSEYIGCALSGQSRRYQITSPDEAYTHESIAEPVLNSNGTQVEHIIVIMRDVTDRIRQERALTIALQQAQAANKSKSSFLANMSHELRTPLNAVIGFSEVLSQEIGGKLSKKQLEYTEFIHKSGTHLLKIINDILEFSKIEVGHCVLTEENANFESILEDSLLMVRERAERKKLRIVVETPERLPALNVDPLRIKQILVNLLSNAVKFTDSGAISIKAHRDSQLGLVIAVCDCGIGMTQDELAMALESFGQVEGAYARKYDGTGLGLPIARQLAELHGGKLWLTSEKGVGTTASFSIPLERLLPGECLTGVAA